MPSERSSGRGRDADVEHQERDRDHEHAVAERLLSFPPPPLPFTSPLLLFPPVLFLSFIVFPLFFLSFDQFANRATAALKDDSVRSLVAEQVTDELVLKHQADLIAARPIIESVVASVVGGRAFTGVFRSGVRDVHRAVFDRDQDTLTLAVVDIGTIVAAGLEVLQPTLARRVERRDGLSWSGGTSAASARRRPVWRTASGCSHRCCCW